MMDLNKPFEASNKFKKKIPFLTVHQSNKAPEEKLEKKTIRREVILQYGNRVKIIEVE